MVTCDQFKVDIDIFYSKNINHALKMQVSISLTLSHFNFKTKIIKWPLTSSRNHIVLNDQFHLKDH